MSQRKKKAANPTPIRQMIHVTPSHDAVQIIPRHALLQLANIMHDVAAKQGAIYARAA